MNILLILIILLSLDYMKVNQLKLKKEMTVSELIEQFDKSGVLGAGRVARASNLLVDMINDDDMDIFMSLGGP